MQRLLDAAGFSYAYDNEGNKLCEQKTDNPSNSEAYAYDGLNRLTNYDVGALSGSIVPSPIIGKGWNLDPVGNWITVISNGVPEIRTHGPANALLTIALLSNLMAILLQALCARLGIASGRDLAQACRDAFPSFIAMPLWLANMFTMLWAGAWQRSPSPLPFPPPTYTFMIRPALSRSRISTARPWPPTPMATT